MEIITEEIEERNRAMSFKRLNMLLNKTRIQDSTCDLGCTTNDPE